MWELNYKESWVLTNVCFWTVVLDKTLESSLDCKEIKPVNLKGNQSWIFIGSTDAEAETPILWPANAKSWFIGKDRDTLSFNHFILCCPLLLLPSIFPSIRVFSNEPVLCIRWPKYWSFSFTISPSSGHPGLISFRMDGLDLLAVQRTLKSLLLSPTPQFKSINSLALSFLYSPKLTSIHNYWKNHSLD